jgi:hypothetical protein
LKQGFHFHRVAIDDRSILKFSSNSSAGLFCFPHRAILKFNTKAQEFTVLYVEIDGG